MIEFALMIAEYLSGKKRRDTLQRSAAEIHRNIPADPMVVECPLCNHLGLSVHDIVEESTDAGKTYQPVNDIFICGNCKEPLDAESMENDGTGVLRAKRWTCPKCGTTNHALKFTCANCQAWRA